MSSPSAQHLKALVGSTVGNSYALERVLGQGRHGALIEARNVRLGQRCLVRMLRADAAKRTALLTALGQHSSVAHPNLSPPRDAVTLPDEQLLLASPLLTGQDLNQRIAAGGKLSASEGVLMMRQIASALHALHQKGLCHGNLTASNVFFTKYDDVTVDNALGDSKGSNIVQLIDAGLSILDGQAQTASDDQRSLGRLVQAFVSDLSSEQRKILERTQDAKPEARFASVVELWRAFEGAGTRKQGTHPERSGSIATTMVPQIRMTRRGLQMRRYGPIGAAAIAVVIVAAMVLSVLTRKSPPPATPPPVAAPVSEPPKGTPPSEPEKPAVAAEPTDDSADAGGEKAGKGKKKKGSKKASKKH
jgi:serine/threonine protein kinase